MDVPAEITNLYTRMEELEIRILKRKKMIYLVANVLHTNGESQRLLHQKINAIAVPHPQGPVDSESAGC